MRCASSGAEQNIMTGVILSPTSVAAETMNASSRRPSPPLMFPPGIVGLVHFLLSAAPHTEVLVRAFFSTAFFSFLK